MRKSLRMASLQHIGRFVRAHQWWAFKIAPALGLFFLFQELSGVAWTSAHTWQAILTAISISIAAVYTSLSNDLFDLESDRLAGKSNRLSGWKPGPLRMLFAAVFAAGAAVTWALSDLLSQGLYVALWVNWTLYSAPPVRTKNRGALGALSDAIGSHMLPTALVVSLTDYDWIAEPHWALIGLAWSLLWGIRGIVWHQLLDWEGDRDSGVNTWAVQLGPSRLANLYVRLIFPLEILAFLSLSAALPFGPQAFVVFVLVKMLLDMATGTTMHIVRPGAPLVLYDWYLIGFPLLAAWHAQPWAMLVMVAGFGLNIAHFFKTHAAQLKASLIHPKSKAIRNATKILCHSESRHKLIAVGHENSRTGAPLILLELLKHFRAVHGEDLCLVVLALNGGELDDAFAEVADVQVRNLGNRPEDFETWLPLLQKGVRNQTAAPGDLLALLNSDVTSPVTEALNAVGLPTTLLIHEFSRNTPIDKVLQRHRAARQLIFPAEIVKDSHAERMREVNPAPQQTPEIAVLPQGVFPSFLEPISELDVHAARQTLAPDRGTFLVLGVGTRDARKAIDLFVLTAEIVRQRAPETDIQFVWLGASHEGTKEFEHLVLGMVSDAGLTERLRFLPAIEDPRPFYAAADALLMCSRLDPYPCVVLEAMAFKTPVVLFDKGVGSAAFVETHGGGQIHKYLNLSSAAQTLIQWSSRDPHYRRLQSQAADAVRTNANFKAYADEIWQRLITTQTEQIK